MSVPVRELMQEVIFTDRPSASVVVSGSEERGSQSSSSSSSSSPSSAIVKITDVDQLTTFKSLVRKYQTISMQYDIQKLRIERLEIRTVIFLCACLILFSSKCEAFPQGFDRFSLTPHAAVIRNAQLESRLPSHLRNPFYQDPKTARALAYSSRLTPGELPVYIRDAEKIPRREIYKMLVHAGFIPRQRSINSLQYL